MSSKRALQQDVGHETASEKKAGIKVELKAGGGLARCPHDSRRSARRVSTGGRALDSQSPLPLGRQTPQPFLLFRAYKLHFRLGPERPFGPNLSILKCFKDRPEVQLFTQKRQ